MHNSLVKLLLLLLALVSPFTSWAQYHVVRGIVKSDLGTVVSAVSVFVKGAARQAQTDVNGRFEVEAESGESLVFVKDGFLSVEVVVGNDAVVNVELPVEDIFSMSLEDLLNSDVSSSSFFSLKGKEAPGFVYSLDLREAPALGSLLDISRMIVPGLSDGAHPDTRIVGVRGMKNVDNSKTIYMFDGQNLNLRSNLGFSLGLTSRLLGDVRSLEVSLGPNALVHGSGAISGYVNMIPKNGLDNPGLFVNVEKEFEHHALNQQAAVSLAEVGYGLGNEKNNLYLYAGWYHSNGWAQDSTFFSPKVTADMRQSQNAGSTPKANFRLSSHANFAGAVNVNLGYMQNSMASFSSSARRQVVFQRQFNARVKYDLGLNDYESILFSVSNELSDMGRVQSAQAGGSEAHLEGKLVAKSVRLGNNSLALGALFGKRWFNVGHFYFGHDVDAHTAGDNVYKRDPATGSSFADDKGKPDANMLWASGVMPDGSWNELAFFAEDIYKLNDVMVFSLGLRYDRFSIDDINADQSNVSPRLALSWLANDNHVVKASYQQGFRTMDLYAFAQTSYVKNADVLHALRKVDEGANFSFDISPEKVHSVELNYHGEFLDNKLSLDVNGFFNTYKNTIDFLPLVKWDSNKYLEEGDAYFGDYTVTGQKCFSNDLQKDFMTNFVSSSYKKNPDKVNTFSAYTNNGEDVQIVGCELIASLVSPAADSKVNFSYSLAKSLSDDYAQVSLHPQHIVKASVAKYLFDKKVSLNANFEFEPAVSGNNADQNFAPVFHEARTLLDASLAYRFAGHAQIYAIVNNILGEARPGITYKPDSSNNYPQYTDLGSSERRFWLGIRVDL